MGRIRQYFDNKSTMLSLNAAIIHLSGFSFCLAISYWMIVKYSSNGDRGGFYLGITLAIMSLLNVLIGFFSIHAIVRRLVAEARNKKI